MEFCAVIEFDIAVAGGGVAGAAAAQAIDSDRAITGIDIAVLQKRLEKENVIIHFDDAWIPTDREKVEYADIGHF